jgi:hypothetical protein
MALIDDPKVWILRLFEMEEREGRGSNCARFPDGTCPPDIPLEGIERVFGIYKGKYYFTPSSLIIKDRGKTERIPWAEVRACSSRHGEGKVFSDVTLVGGNVVRVRVGDMATGWCGRISQLYHQMIEKLGQRVALGRPPMPMREFFEKACDDYRIAPNLEPHPSLEVFRATLLQLEHSSDGTNILMDLVEDDDESLVADAIVVVTPLPKEDIQSFAETFGADGVVAADDRTNRRVGAVPEGFNVWRILWD